MGGKSYGMGLLATRTGRERVQIGGVRRRLAGAPWGGLLFLLSASALAAPTMPLEGGFWPDPREIRAEVAGVESAAGWVRGCPGLVADEPALVVELSDPELPLRFLATGGGMAALIVVTPDGVHHCASAAGTGTSTMRMEQAEAGSYSLWPSMSEPGTPVEIRLLVSELDIDSSWVGDTWSEGATISLDRGTPPAFGAVEWTGEEPLMIGLTLSGGEPASSVVPYCSGQIDTSRPDVVVSVGAPEPGLAFRVRSETDTTLLVLDPDGGIYCDDDSHGHDPEVVLANAVPGDYAVWVGVFSGTGGDSAVLTVSRESGSVWAGQEEHHPLLGRDFETAADAFRILVSEQPLAGLLRYREIEEQGAEGFVLHGVVIAGIEDSGQEVSIERIRVSDLDLEGLASPWGPDRFALSLEGIDYAALMDGAQALGRVPLPELEGPLTMSLDLSLLPIGDDLKAVAFGVQLDGQFGLSLRFLGRPIDDDEPFGAMGAIRLAGEAIELEIRDFGFGRIMLDAQAREMGITLEELVAEGLRELAAVLGQGPADSPGARILAALGAALSDLDRPGMLRFVLDSEQPMTFAELLAALIAGEGASAIQFSAEYRRLE